MAKGDSDVQLMMTASGVGYYIGLLIKADIGDVDRFSTRDHLASYAGIVLSTRSSSGVEMHGRITHEIFKLLRWMLVEAAMVHVRHDSRTTRFCHRVAERCGCKPTFIAATCMLAAVCYSVSVHKRLYFKSLHTQA